MSKEMVTIYRCDWCKTALSNPEENIATSHLSIVIGSHSGWWELTDIETTMSEERWHCTKTINPGIYHFCNAQHFGNWVAGTSVDKKE